ncbi:hsc70-interacting protein-like [Culicoides brevitarsis]|uniref:hsc70-interacting protein-like n=1 Tax=Culicoides brevitarsis TaxID=469753 RepID=UPI00307BE874
MSCPIGKEELAKLKAFISVCSAQPQLLNMPELEFFKSFIEKLGGKVPAAPTSQKSAHAEASFTSTKAPEPEPEVESEEEPESDLELDNEGCVEPDSEQPEMGDESKEPTEEDEDKASEFRGKAAGAYSEQKFDEAVKLYTEAIKLNPRSALFHAKRGQVYLKLRKPNACIIDCNRALELNADSAAAYKFRGRAHRLLGKWEEAAKDLRQACKLDFDEEADEWLREVTPNAKKIEQHKLKQERKKMEREEKQRKERVRRAQEANRKAREENVHAEAHASAGAGGEDFMSGEGADFLNAFKDPEVAAAMQDILQNPGNISKYMGNPKIMNLLSKVSGQMGGGGMPFGAATGGMPGGMPGGFGGMPGFGAGGMPGFGMPGGMPNFGAGATPNPSNAPPKPDFHDDGLD